MLETEPTTLLSPKPSPPSSSPLRLAALASKSCFCQSVRNSCVVVFHIYFHLPFQSINMTSYRVGILPPELNLKSKKPAVSILERLISLLLRTLGSAFLTVLCVLMLGLHGVQKPRKKISLTMLLAGLVHKCMQVEAWGLAC